MSTSSIGQLSVRYVRLTRSCITILGCIAVWWGITGLPIFWKQSLVQRVANNIIAGELFRNATLTSLLPIVDSIQTAVYCDPIAFRSAVIIQLRMLDIELQTNDPGGFGKDLALASEAIRRYLSCSPADPFMWLSLYQAENMRNGDRADYLKYLRLSYQLGPNEGWIALKRNRLVFSNVDNLSMDLVHSGINEFVILLKTRQFIAGAADIFTGPAWKLRDEILPRLSELSKSDRDIFAGILRSRGYDVPITGVRVH